MRAFVAFGLPLMALASQQLRPKRVQCQVLRLQTRYSNDSAEESYICRTETAHYRLELPLDEYTPEMTIEVMHPSIRKDVLRGSGYRILSQFHRKLQVSGTGVRSVFMVRVSTANGQPGPSLSDMRNLFNPNEVNFATQYDACSYGQLQFRLEQAVDVSLASTYATPLAAVLAAEQQLKSQYGDNLADHVYYCLPTGLGWRPDWTAASAGTHRSFYNDEWCLSLSASMHELGHNLQLHHSGTVANDYGDTSGMMGASKVQAHQPQRCFNGYKSWQLGWYAGHQLYVEPQAEGQLVDLATFIDLPKTTKPVAINVGNRFYLQYNVAAEMNAGTASFRNQVSIVEPQDNKSIARDGLSAGDIFATNWQGQQLRIEACHAVTQGASYMTLSIGLGNSLCHQASLPAQQAQEKPPAPAPVTEDTSFPTSFDPNRVQQSLPAATPAPSSSPTTAPTRAPTSTTTPAPSRVPTRLPTESPTPLPTEAPTRFPTKMPPPLPTNAPTRFPTLSPTVTTTTTQPVPAVPLPTLTITHMPTVPTSAPTPMDRTPEPTPAPSPDPRKVWEYIHLLYSRLSP